MICPPHICMYIAAGERIRPAFSSEACTRHPSLHLPSHWKPSPAKNTIKHLGSTWAWFSLFPVYCPCYCRSRSSSTPCLVSCSKKRELCPSISRTFRRTIQLEAPRRSAPPLHHRASGAACCHARPTSRTPKNKRKGDRGGQKERLVDRQPACAGRACLGRCHGDGWRRFAPNCPQGARERRRPGRTVQSRNSHCKSCSS